jgi:predicted dehydrogenase
VTELKSIINEIDAAIVVSPTSTHMEQVNLLLDHQKHVFCEKPLAHNYNSAKELYLKAKSFPSKLLRKSVTAKDVIRFLKRKKY